MEIFWISLAQQFACQFIDYIAGSLRFITGFENSFVVHNSFSLFNYVRQNFTVSFIILF